MDLFLLGNIVIVVVVFCVGFLIGRDRAWKKAILLEERDTKIIRRLQDKYFALKDKEKSG